MGRAEFGYYIIVGELMMDINDLDIHMLTATDIDELETIATESPDYVEERAYDLHTKNLADELQGLTSKDV